MDWEKLEYHRTSNNVTEQWLFQANLTKKELEYITNKPEVDSRFEPAYRARYGFKDPQYQQQEDVKFLSSTKSKQIEGFPSI